MHQAISNRNRIIRTNTRDQIFDASAASLRRTVRSFQELLLLAELLTDGLERTWPSITEIQMIGQGRSSPLDEFDLGLAAFVDRLVMHRGSAPTQIPPWHLKLV